MRIMNEIIIYKTPDQRTEIEVRFEDETVWLSQVQIATLFKQTKQNISLHINNCYKEGELVKKATVKESLTVQKEGKRTVNRKLEYYNLDVIISVGYRVKSKRGTQFRQWATQRLKDYLVKGYSINQKRLLESQNNLRELNKAISLLGNVAETQSLTGEEVNGLLKVLHNYAHALNVLDQYDHQTLQIPESTSQELSRITYTEAVKAIQNLKEKFGGSKLFGKEKDSSFKSSLEAIYQTFDGKELYPSVEEKAAHLLYFVIKNHSFTDGNKRIGAFLFVWFLENNKLLFDGDKKLIDDNTLVALTLMVAASKPDDKNMMIKVIVNLLNNRI